MLLVYIQLLECTKKYILEKNYDLEVTSMNLLILHPYYQSYHVVKIDELPLETDYLINSL